jgi:hypothetical protein
LRTFEANAGKDPVEKARVEEGEWDGDGMGGGPGGSCIGVRK